MQIIKDLNSLQAEIGRMHPTHAEASQLLASRLLERTEALTSPEMFREELMRSTMMVAMANGIDPEEDTAAFFQWLGSDADRIAVVGYSAARLVIEEHERQKKWLWLGKAAAIVAGAALGALFA